MTVSNIQVAFWWSASTLCTPQVWLLQLIYYGPQIILGSSTDKHGWQSFGQMMRRYDDHLRVLTVILPMIKKLIHVLLDCSLGYGIPVHFRELRYTSISQNTDTFLKVIDKPIWMAIKKIIACYMILFSIRIFDCSQMMNNCSTAVMPKCDCPDFGHSVNVVMVYCVSSHPLLWCWWDIHIWLVQRAEQFSPRSQRKPRLAL